MKPLNNNPSSEVKVLLETRLDCPQNDVKKTMSCSQTTKILLDNSSSWSNKPPQCTRTPPPSPSNATTFLPQATKSSLETLVNESACSSHVTGSLRNCRINTLISPPNSRKRARSDDGYSSDSKSPAKTTKIPAKLPRKASKGHVREVVANSSWVERSQESSSFWTVNGANLRHRTERKATLYAAHVSQNPSSTIRKEKHMESPLSLLKDKSKQDTIPFLSSDSSSLQEPAVSTTSLVTLSQKTPSLHFSKLPKFKLSQDHRKHIHSAYCGHRSSDQGSVSAIQESAAVRKNDWKRQETQDAEILNNAVDKWLRGNETNRNGSQTGRNAAYTGRIPTSSPSHPKSNVPFLGEKSVRTGKIRIVTGVTYMCPYCQKLLNNPYKHIYGVHPRMPNPFMCHNSAEAREKTKMRDSKAHTVEKQQCTYCPSLCYWAYHHVRYMHPGKPNPFKTIRGIS